MGQAIPRQHPAVVLRSHFIAVRSLLVVAMIAVVGLTAAVVVMATDDDASPATAGAPVIVSAPGPEGIRYDGGPEEGGASLRSVPAPAPAPATRYDGGPEEGSSGSLVSGATPETPAGIRYDGGPEEGSAGR
jgi:hypothetical protein